MNKYLNWCNSIIENALNRVTLETVEIHHIIPRSHGGSNDKSNLVALTIREHILVHWLLTKIHPNCYKMAHAFQMMTTTRTGSRITPIMAAKAKQKVRDTMPNAYEDAKEFGIFMVLPEGTKSKNYEPTKEMEGKCPIRETYSGGDKANIEGIQRVWIETGYRHGVEFEYNGKTYKAREIVGRLKSPSKFELWGWEKMEDGTFGKDTKIMSL